MISEWEEMVRDENMITFYHSSFAHAKTAFSGIQSNPSIVLITEEGEKIVFDKPGLPKKHFKEFLRYHEVPVIAQCTDKFLENMEKAKRTAIFLFREQSNPALEAEFKDLATSWRSKEYAFIMSDIKDGACKKVAENFGIEAKDLPTMQIISGGSGERGRYATKGPFSGVEMKKLMKDWKEGKAKRVYKSEDVPATNEGPVYKATHNTWEEVVIKPDADVLVKFYAPWCGHCQKLAPIYKELAEKLSSNKKIKLVEIDMTKNEIPGISISGYPTLKLFKAKSKMNPKPFDGERTLEGMKKFLEAETSFPADFKVDL